MISGSDRILASF